MSASLRPFTILGGAGGGGGGSGDVVGPAGAIANRIVTFNGATGKLIKDGGVLIADLATVASLPTYGTATLNFGVWPGSGEASVVVGTQPLITTSDRPLAFFSADDTSVSYTAADHRFLATLISLTCGTPVDATGFTIYARSLYEMQGSVTVNWVW